MENIQIILSFIVPLVLIFFMIKKNFDTTFFLIVGAIVSGIIAGLPLTKMLSILKSGFGSVLSQIGLLLLFGMIFSEYLEASGGIACLARFIAKKTSPQGSIYAMYAFGYVISIPVNYTAALTMIAPLTRKLAENTKKPIQSYACAFGISAFLTNCLVVPTLTPALLAGMAGIELGPFMMIGIVISLIASIAAALGSALFLAKKYGSIEHVGEKPADFITEESDKPHPNVRTVILLILFPIVLIMLGTFVPGLLPEGSLIREIAAVIGDPVGALFLTIVIEMITLRKYLEKGVMKVFNDGLLHVSNLLIITGAANAFGLVLAEGGIGNLLLNWLSNTNIPVLLLAFLMVAILHAGVGSMVVAATTSLSLLLPMVQATGGSPTLLVCACCLGCVTFMLPNSTEFFIFRDAYKLSNKDTLVSIAIPGTIAGIIGIICLLIFNVLVPGFAF